MSSPIIQQPIAQILQIIRNVTGRVDSTDPAFTDPILIDYLNAFIQQQHPSEVQIFENKTWWEFPIDPTTQNPMDVDLDLLGFSTINAPAYIANIGAEKNSFQIAWYLDPIEFYRRWPWETDYTPQMPTAVLYHNNQLLFRGPPDKAYQVRISAYKVDYTFAGGTFSNSGSVLSGTGQGYDTIRSYLIRYLAYGTSINILSDYGETERVAEVYQSYKLYKANVTARTWNQLSTQRTSPDF